MLRASRCCLKLASRATGPTSEPSHLGGGQLRQGTAQRSPKPGEPNSRIGHWQPLPVCRPSGAPTVRIGGLPLPLRHLTGIGHYDPRQARYGPHVKKMRVDPSAYTTRVLLVYDGARAVAGSYFDQIAVAGVPPQSQNADLG
jgi:hypothetical protein